MKNVSERDWCNVFISKKVITFEDTMYRANEDKVGSKKGSRNYYWNEQQAVLKFTEKRLMYEKCNV